MKNHITIIIILFLFSLSNGAHSQSGWQRIFVCNTWNIKTPEGQIIATGEYCSWQNFPRYESPVIGDDLPGGGGTVVGPNSEMCLNHLDTYDSLPQSCKQFGYETWDNFNNYYHFGSTWESMLCGGAGICSTTHWMDGSTDLFGSSGDGLSSQLLNIVAPLTAFGINMTSVYSQTWPLINGHCSQLAENDQAECYQDATNFYVALEPSNNISNIPSSISAIFQYFNVNLNEITEDEGDQFRQRVSEFKQCQIWQNRRRQRCGQ